MLTDVFSFRMHENMGTNISYLILKKNRYSSQYFDSIYFCNKVMFYHILDHSSFK